MKQCHPVHGEPQPDFQNLREEIYTNHQCFSDADAKRYLIGITSDFIQSLCRRYIL